MTLQGTVLPWAYVLIAIRVVQFVVLPCLVRCGRGRAAALLAGTLLEPAQRPTPATARRRRQLGQPVELLSSNRAALRAGRKEVVQEFASGGLAYTAAGKGQWSIVSAISTLYPVTTIALARILQGRKATASSQPESCSLWPEPPCWVP